MHTIICKVTVSHRLLFEYVAPQLYLGSDTKNSLLATGAVGNQSSGSRRVLYPTGREYAHVQKLKDSSLLDPANAR
jgi:hypothetical protein